MGKRPEFRGEGGKNLNFFATIFDGKIKKIYFWYKTFWISRKRFFGGRGEKTFINGKNFFWEKFFSFFKI